MCVSPKLRKRIAVEMELLRRLLSRHPELIEKCRREDPSHIEIDALATILHSFYGGVENLFKIIVNDLDDGLPNVPTWHTVLLARVTQPTESRPAVISEALAATLKDYLDFRHVFRHAYAFELQWSRMAHLVWDVEETFRRLEEEVARFLARLPKEE